MNTEKALPAKGTLLEMLKNHPSETWLYSPRSEYLYKLNGLGIIKESCSDATSILHEEIHPKNIQCASVKKLFLYKLELDDFITYEAALEAQQ